MMLSARANFNSRNHVTSKAKRCRQRPQHDDAALVHCAVPRWCDAWAARDGQPCPKISALATGGLRTTWPFALTLLLFAFGGR